MVSLFRLNKLIDSITEKMPLASNVSPIKDLVVDVESSTMTRVGFRVYPDEVDTLEELGDLDVTFKNGDIYRYSKIPKSVFNQLRSAPSVGRYYIQNIKGQYPVKRIY